MLRFQVIPEGYSTRRHTIVPDGDQVVVPGCCCWSFLDGRSLRSSASFLGWELFGVVWLARAPASLSSPLALPLT